MEVIQSSKNNPAYLEVQACPVLTSLKENPFKGFSYNQ